jgi:hypothetical protein
LLNGQSGSVLGDSTVFSWAGCHKEEEDYLLDVDLDEPAPEEEDVLYDVIQIKNEHFTNELAKAVKHG